MINLENGDEITFWTQTAPGSAFPDRLEVRMSPDGSATAPASPTDVGSYTELLLEINPALTMGGYPEVWTEFTAVVSGLTGAVDTSVAFRYFVTDGGPAGSNSNFILAAIIIGLVFIEASLTKRLSCKRSIIVGFCIPAIYQVANTYVFP